MASVLPFPLLKPKPTIICKASSISAPPTSPSYLVESLNDQFGRKGIKFLELTDKSTNIITPIVELSVRNGSSLRLQIPNAHITSYKPKVYWKDDGFEEVLYTLPQSKGGIGLVLNDVTQPDGVGAATAKKPDPFRRSEPAAAATKGSVLAGVDWSVNDVDSDSFDAAQVELSCTSGTLDIKYVVSLYLESMAAAVLVKNNGRKAISLTSAILSHIKFKKRGGAGIQGLKGCSYCSHPPLSSPFEILSPAEAMKADDPGMFSFSSESPSKPGQWTTQDKPITILKNKCSRVYTAPPSERSKAFYRTTPSKYETIDQGKELMFRMIRLGYDDIYVSSPGSFSEKYGRDYFICTGPASMLEPVTVNPGEGWRGAQHITFNKRDFVSPVSVNSPSISYPQPPSFNVEYLDREFGSHGVSFTELGQSYVIRMLLENGSAVSMLMPSGLITSYKPKMWFGSSIEVLHTSVLENGTVQGGVSLALDCVGDNEFSWSPKSWVLNDVKGSSQDSIQVEIVSRELGKMVEVKHNVTLKDDTLSSEVNVLNSRSSQLELTGSILSHLTVSTPEATYACGLEGSDFFNKLPFNSDICIVPPNLSENNAINPSQSWPTLPLKKWFTGNRDVRETNDETEGEESDNYKHLSEEMSKIYTSAPRNFTIIDRGRRNSVVVGRKGFEELYMYSPGSSHESYGKFAYVCVGQSAILKPIRLGPEQGS
ncbi:Photosynthetic NDH subunit of subcomplex B 2 chloroplastic [Bienertia sinuspersici]